MPEPAGTGLSCTSADLEGRPFDLQKVVVNFANVGSTFGERVMHRPKGRLFVYEGVRRCVSHLRSKGFSVIGVIYENFHGVDSDEHGHEVEVRQVPDDIVKLCETIELTPRIAGAQHRSADDEMTIKCAYRRNCRFLDNDNYKDWLRWLRDEKARTWLQRHQDFLQMRFFFDSGLGTFDTLDGNIPHVAAGPALKKPRH